MEATYTPAQRNVLSVLHVGGITNGIHSHTIDASRGCGQWCGNLQRFGNSQQKKASTGATYVLSELFWWKSADVHLICDKKSIYLTEQ